MIYYNGKKIGNWYAFKKVSGVSAGGSLPIMNRYLPLALCGLNIKEDYLARLKELATVNMEDPSIDPPACLSDLVNNQFRTFDAYRFIIDPCNLLPRLCVQTSGVGTWTGWKTYQKVDDVVYNNEQTKKVVVELHYNSSNSAMNPLDIYNNDGEAIAKISVTISMSELSNDNIFVLDHSAELLSGADKLIDDLALGGAMTKEQMIGLIDDEITSAIEELSAEELYKLLFIIPYLNNSISSAVALLSTNN